MRTVDVLFAAVLAVVNPSGLELLQPAPAPAVHVAGAVAHPLTLTAADLATMPHRSVTASAHQLSGTWEGVEVRELLSRAGVPANEALRGRALATAVTVTGADGYRVVFGIAESIPLSPTGWRSSRTVRLTSRCDSGLYRIRCCSHAGLIVRLTLS